MNQTQCPLLACQDRGRNPRCFFAIYENCEKYTHQDHRSPPQEHNLTESKLAEARGLGL